MTKHVRLWRKWTGGAGSSSRSPAFQDLPRHPANLAVVFESGIEANLRFVEFTAGDIRWRDPVTHSIENIGKIRLHAIIVELET